MTDKHRSHDIVRDLKCLTRVIGGLNSFVNDTVDDRQSVEVESHAWNGAVSDQLVVLIELIEECRAVMLQIR
jgi:hypothetical protein